MADANLLVIGLFEIDLTLQTLKSLGQQLQLHLDVINFAVCQSNHTNEVEGNIELTGMIMKLLLTIKLLHITHSILRMFQKSAAGLVDLGIPW